MHFVSHFFIDGWTYPQAWTLIARFLGLTWGPSGADRNQVGPMLAPWTLLSGKALFFVVSQHSEYMLLCLEFIMLFMMVDFMQQFRNWFSLLRVYFNIYLISVLSDKCARHWPCFTFAGASHVNIMKMQWPCMNPVSYTLGREYRVMRNRYSRLLFTSEDRLCANLRVQEQSTNMTSQC